MVCTKCGKQVRDDAQFCPSCGATMPHSSAATAAYATPQGALVQEAPEGMFSQTQKIVLIALIAIALVLVVVITVLFLPSSRKAIAIDSAHFPNENVRNAVLVQLDIDGDGILSLEEADAVTSIVATPTGVRFITTDDDEDYVDDYMKMVAAGFDSGTQTGMGDNSNNGVAGNPGKSSNSQNGFAESIKPFPETRALYVRGQGLTELDLKSMPNLEYADCRDNFISNLDLSKSKELVSLLCDENVKLDGLDSSDLYYRDLVSSLSADKFADKTPTEFTYDYMGRVVTAGNKSFTYDESGRLSSAQGAYGGEPSWNHEYEEYTYSADGLLSKISLKEAFSIGDQVTECTFDYGDKNRLTTFSRNWGEGARYEGTLGYSRDAIASMKTARTSGNVTQQSSYKITTDNSNRITQIDSTSSSQGSTAQSSSAGTYTFAYLTNGECTNYESSLRADDVSGGLDAFAYKTKLASNNAPQSTAVHTQWGDKSDKTVDLKYETNADGYITKMVTPSNDDSTVLVDSTMSISYVKHVGRLEDLSSQRYVPVFRVENTIYPLDDMTYHLNMDLYSSTGNSPSVSILEDGPMQTTFQAMGLAPNLVSNPNEQKLADYLAEHWSDPIEVKETAPSPEETTQPSPSIEVESTPVIDPARVIDTEYFTFTMPESWVGEVEMTTQQSGNATSNQAFHDYYFKLKDDNGDHAGWYLLLIMVTNDASGELGQVSELGQFTTSGGLEGYICYDPFLLAGEEGNSPYVDTFVSLLSGGQIKHGDSNASVDLGQDTQIINAWLKENIVPNIKAK